MLRAAENLLIHSTVVHWIKIRRMLHTSRAIFSITKIANPNTQVSTTPNMRQLKQV
jgi:hypothetical protein